MVGISEGKTLGSKLALGFSLGDPDGLLLGTRLTVGGSEGAELG